MSEADYDPGHSTDSTHSTWAPVTLAEDTDPPTGSHAEEQLGYPQVYLPAITGMSPTSCPPGPPDDVLLTVTGTDFTPDAVIAFGKDAQGQWILERTSHPANDTLTTVISAGLFPNPDPAIPVAVVNVPPNGPVSGEATFTIGP